MNAEAEKYNSNIIHMIQVALVRINKKFQIVSIQINHLDKQVELIKKRIAEQPKFEEGDAITLKARFSELQDRTEQRMVGLKKHIQNTMQRQINTSNAYDTLMKDVSKLTKENKLLREQMDGVLRYFEASLPKKPEAEPKKEGKNLDESMKDLQKVIDGIEVEGEPNTNQEPPKSQQPENQKGNN
jgi:hypothetical protein